MAPYFLSVKIVSRGKGSKATRAAAYRAGEFIRDERSGAVYNHTDRTDVAHAQIVLPTGCADQADMQWALERSTLWNAAEHAGRRKNSRLAREILVLVPPEFTPAQRVELVRGFSQELSDRYGNAVDFAIHRPRPQADERHHHAHMLMTTREVGPGGLGARTTLELNGTDRHARGLPPTRDELLWMRERWGQVLNEALREAGVVQRVDHRSYQAQGIDREPQPRIPPAILYVERRLGRSIPAGEAIRAQYRERVEARLTGPEELARVVKRQKEEGRERAIQSAGKQSASTKTPHGALTRQELYARKREWYKANAARINALRREHRKQHPDLYAARRWAKMRARQAAEKPGQELAPVVSGAEPATATSPTAEESVKNWLVYRENQQRAEAAHGASPDGAREQPDTDAGRVDEDAGKSSGRGRNHDFSL
jgi:hypothetical protein